MERVAIELNDAGLLIADTRAVLASEPGYAIVDEAELIIGSAAYQQARLLPAKARSGFWSTLSVAAGAADAQAELAYRHLKQVWSEAGRPDSAAVLVVPGSYNAQQLGLVLGIAHECDIRVEAMVDSAVAASALRYQGRQLLHVDASLRTVSCTRVEQSDAAAVAAHETSTATGLADFTDEMARAIARVFVLDTRFDPLHKAETEQSLYVGLPAWLDALHREGGVTAEIEHAGKPVAVELTAERVRSASLRLFREIARLVAQLRAPNMPAVVQLPHRLAALPGLRSELERIDGISLSELAPGFPATSALERVQTLDAPSDEVRLLRRLPFVAEAELPPIETGRGEVTRKPDRAPTHVIFQGVGYRLSSGRTEITGTAPSASINGARTIAIGSTAGAPDTVHCALVFDNGALAIDPGAGSRLRVNGDLVAGRRSLAVGDVVLVGEPAAELHIVAMED
jgi:hypothetical protein